LLVREAGGRVTTFGKAEKVLDSDATLVATNGHIHSELLSVLKSNKRVQEENSKTDPHR